MIHVGVCDSEVVNAVHPSLLENLQRTERIAST